MSKPSPRSDRAYSALRQAIIEQALLPGAKLPEDEIGAHFGMSRTLARSTLARLKAEGLVDAPVKRTATVARPSLAEARDVFEVRRALEREAVALVIRRWRPEFGATLEGHVRDEEAARARRDDRLSIRLAGEFHTLLAGMSGNAVLERALTELVTRCSLILALYGRPHSSECAVSEHSQIIGALRGKDTDAAVRLMEEHVGSVEQRALSDVPGPGVSLGAVLARYAASDAADNVVALPADGRPSKRGRSQ
ncbi:GntR family transcriptional regulator [Lichenifustis flavocetrariae]|uniref:GntR family transcriptional regulator n=1 Tax=Lichenifustis flavocetrariae TaxID=2949735 RepID=A0AA41YST2_9HYPH|nr:GntR family transcriptional regulator [Lichenifustis flavocetrariae]MCW6507934.1 GntR family transcriptional regulator [Lichenifustis flavocetrariae]